MSCMQRVLYFPPRSFTLSSAYFLFVLLSTSFLHTRIPRPRSLPSVNTPTRVWEFLSSAMVAFYASSALLFSALLATGFANAFNINDIKKGSE